MAQPTNKTNNRVQLGNLISEVKQGKSGKYPATYLALGNRSKDKKWQRDVTITVKDGDGNVVHEQTNGFVSLVDPRTAPAQLLQAKAISETTYESMVSNLTKLPDKIKYNLIVKNTT